MTTDYCGSRGNCTRLLNYTHAFRGERNKFSDLRDGPDNYLIKKNVGM
jgi:hypothetical protein